MNAVFGTLLGVVVGGLMTIFKDWIFRRQDRKKHAAYLAIRVSAMLDRFVYAAGAIVSDSGAREDDETFAPATALAAIAFEELDVDWRTITPDLSYRILGLQNDVERDMGILLRLLPADAVFEGEGSRFFFRKKAYARHGLKAADLSLELRKACGLPEPEGEFWDVLDILESFEAQDPPPIRVELVQ